MKMYYKHQSSFFLLELPQVVKSSHISGHIMRRLGLQIGHTSTKDEQSQATGSSENL